MPIILYFPSKQVAYASSPLVPEDRQVDVILPARSARPPESHPTRVVALDSLRSCTSWFGAPYPLTRASVHHWQPIQLSGQAIRTCAALRHWYKHRERRPCCRRPISAPRRKRTSRLGVAACHRLSPSREWRQGQG